MLSASCLPLTHPRGSITGTTGNKHRIPELCIKCKGKGDRLPCQGPYKRRGQYYPASAQNLGTFDFSQTTLSLPLALKCLIPGIGPSLFSITAFHYSPLFQIGPIIQSSKRKNAQTLKRNISRICEFKTQSKICVSEEEITRWNPHRSMQGIRIQQQRLLHKGCFQDRRALGVWSVR